MPNFEETKSYTRSKYVAPDRILEIFKKNSKFENFFVSKSIFISAQNHLGNKKKYTRNKLFFLNFGLPDFEIFDFFLYFSKIMNFQTIAYPYGSRYFHASFLFSVDVYVDYMNM